MKITGDFNLIDAKDSLKQNDSLLVVERGEWEAIFPPGLVTNGASIPWPFHYLFGGRFNKDFDQSAFIHDQLCGEINPAHEVMNSKGETRTLSWKESAAWFYDALRCEDRNANGKVRRKVFYHAVMLKKRLRLVVTRQHSRQHPPGSRRHQ